MANLTIWDHAFSLIVFLAFPVYAKLTFQKAIDAIRERGEPALIRSYKETILSWIVFAIAVAAMWVGFDREWAEIGVRLADLFPLLAGLGAAALIILGAIWPLKRLSQSPDGSATLEKHMGDVYLFMPRSKKEGRWFSGASVNAGLWEELVFRGYLIWYLEHFMGIWPAALIAVLLFGLAHMYQGLKPLPGIIVISAIAMSLYLFTGSLLVPVLFHIFFDAIQGHYIAKIKRMPASPA